MFSEAAASRDGGASGAGEVVAIGGGDTVDDAELAQAGEASGEGGGRALGEEWEEVGAPEAGDIESGTLEGRKQGLFGVAEEVETPDAAAFDRVRLGETVERPDTGREVVQTGEVFEVAVIGYRKSSGIQKRNPRSGQLPSSRHDGLRFGLCW